MNNIIRNHYPILIVGSIVMAGLFFIGRTNYLLFHALVEMFSVVTAFTIFVLTWNSRRYINSYLLFLGISFLVTGGIDLLHTLSYTGMGVFAGTQPGEHNASNLSTQLWLAARYVEAVSLVLAPIFLRRPARPVVLLLGFGAAGALLLLSIFTFPVFPAAYLDGIGLTAFKKGSEYAIIALLALSVLELYVQRSAFDRDVLGLLLLGIGTTMLSEFAFVEYLAVTDEINMLGHFLKIVAFYFFYKAIIETGFLKPHDLLFRELAQRERDLAASEIRERTRALQLEAIMDVVPAVVWIAHDARASVVTGNRASAEILRMEPKKNQSKTPDAGEAPAHFIVLDRDGKELAPNELPLQVSAASGQPVRDFEETLVFEDGSERHLFGNVTPLKDAAGRPAGAVGAFIDITERVHAEEALQASEQRYRGLFERMGEAFSLHEILLDEEGKPVDYSILQVNPAFERMTGLTREQVVGKTIRQLVPDLEPQWIERYAKVALSGEVVRFEDYSSLLDKYFEVLVYPAGGMQVAALSFDVTERYRNQRALRQSEARLRRLVDANIIGIIYTDEKGTVIHANDAFLDTVGYTRDDLEAGLVNWETMTPPEHLPRDREGILEAYERGACTPYEKEYIRKDGTRVPILIGYAYFVESAIPFVCFILDLTQQKRAEASVLEYAAQLERSNRELQDFAFVASHDLQEPLRKIQAFGERLNTRVKDQLDDSARDYMDRMLSATRRMSAMINDLLSLSRVTTRGQAFEQVNLMEIARDVISDLELRIERTGGRVELESLPVIEADPIQMHQLLQNLIGNALKFHRPGVPPVVRLYSEESPDHCWVIISIQDNGIGFDEQFLERIFQPFQRLHGRSEYEGSGIGLAVCRKIVERHAGTITAHSDGEHGATFVVTLPARRAKCAEERPALKDKGASLQA